MSAIEGSSAIQNHPADFSDRIINLFLSFYKEVFRYMEDFKYDEDERKTGVMIYDKFARNLDTTGNRPSLITDLKSINKGDTILNDLHGIGNAGMMRTGNSVYTDLFNTVLIVHALSSVMAESRHLSYLAGFSVFALKEEFFKKGIFHLSVPTVVGETRKLVTSSQGEIWSTPVTIRVYFQEAWIVQQIQTDILQKLSIQINKTNC
jgi:hypothetical protein